MSGPFTTWLPVVPGSEVWALLPAPRDRLHELCASLRTAGLDTALLERCRATITSVVTGRPVDRTAASDAERAAVAFAEQFVLDPRGVTDGQVAELHRLFAAPQLAALTTAVATFDAVARVEAVLADPAGVPASTAVPLEYEEDR